MGRYVYPAGHERTFGGGASFRFRKERHPPRMVIILQGGVRNYCFYLKYANLFYFLTGDGVCFVAPLDEELSLAKEFGGSNRLDSCGINGCSNLH